MRKPAPLRVARALVQRRLPPNRQPSARPLASRPETAHSLRRVCLLQRNTARAAGPLHCPLMKGRNPRAPRIALALAGGGPLGAIYEIGALCALDEALQGVAFTRLHHYVGVSAGSFIAAGLANGVSPRELCASFIENDASAGEVFDPSWLMVPAWREFGRRAAGLPKHAASALWHGIRRRSFTDALERLGPLLPTGIFSNELVDRRLAELFT